MDYATMMLGGFDMTERTDLPWKLAKEYYERCEAYDRTVCSGEREGVAMPIDHHEMGLINRHALRVMRELRGRCEAAGFTAKDFQDARHEYLRVMDKR